MGEKIQKLQINRDLANQSKEISSRNEILHITRNIEGIEKNISDLESRRLLDLGELAQEKNYDLLFYFASLLVLFNLIFKFSLIAFYIALFFALMFAIYKIFFTKKQRAKRINDEINREIFGLQERLEEREEDIQNITNKSGL